MSIKIEETALLGFLARKSPVYAGKAQEIREAVEGWLSFIPHSFPHYTRHTISHSDEIVRQLSQLLFVDGDSTRPVLEHLSAIEAYILIAAAYFHDAGMVVPDQEKVEILKSDEWKTWISPGGGGANRWLEIDSFRREGRPTDETVRTFLADVQTRFLIAEFVRRTHHLRAADVLEQYQSALGRFAFDDPSLLHTISTVCVAHGLRQHELLDKSLFPERRDIRGEKVNVRLMAILLRIGDLLDMSADRACPLLLNAACPLPQDSFAHWTQYQRIQHRVTAPDRIEVEALCNNQEEHRVLRDWCQWLVAEVREAAVTMARSSRHAEWLPPLASVEGREATISIRPALGAKYFPSEWTFELDHDAIFKRLIYDAYDDPRIFVRELIQNAADANRCKLIQDYCDAGHAMVDSPPDIPEEWRERYPIRVSIEEVERHSALSGEVEKKQVFVIEDEGLGMDEDVIKRYLLQVGRSFYNTEEFRRRFSFIPTSRFGLGFLSTFAASDDITLETWKDESDGGPLRLRLTGPRNYLLTEKGNRERAGTRIEAVLNRPFSAGDLTSLISNWCRRLEFPVLVNDLGQVETVRAEKPEGFVQEVPRVDRKDSVLTIRHFPIEEQGISGQIYILTTVTDTNETWEDNTLLSHSYLNLHPHATIPVLPSSAMFFHGIALSPEARLRSGGIACRVDLRGTDHRVDMSRRNFGYDLWDIPAVQATMEKLIHMHLAQVKQAQGENGWIYRNELARMLPLERVWGQVPEMIPIYRQARKVLASAHQLEHETLSICSTRADSDGVQEFASRDAPMLFLPEVLMIADSVRRQLFGNRYPKSVERTDQGTMLITLEHGEQVRTVSYQNNIFFLNMPTERNLGFSIALIGSYNYTIFINLLHPLGPWLQRALLITEDFVEYLPSWDPGRLRYLLNSVITHGGMHIQSFRTYVTAWRELEIPSDLMPPDFDAKSLRIPIEGRARAQGK